MVDRTLFCMVSLLPDWFKTTYRGMDWNYPDMPGIESKFYKKYEKGKQDESWFPF